MRTTILPEFPNTDWALDVPVKDYDVSVGDDYIECENIRCEIKEGRLIFSYKEKTVLEEKFYPWALHKTARHYKAISALSKLVLVFDMLAGRLEIFPILTLFSASAWRRQ